MMARPYPKRCLLLVVIIALSFFIYMYWLEVDDERRRKCMKEVSLLAFKSSDTLNDIPGRGMPKTSHSNLDSTQTKSHIWAPHPACSDCMLPRKSYFYSQSREDRALFKHFFTTPLYCGGTFVEIGALDGVTFSNTKFFEDTLGWNGVLIEAQPENAKRLMVNRKETKNYALAICTEGDSNVSFIGSGAVGGVVGEMTEGRQAYWMKSTAKKITVPCRTMGAILRDAAVTKVNLFSLDVEGAELTVLQTMDWSIPVGVFVIEMDRAGAADGTDNAIRQLLSDHGYRESKWDIMTACEHLSERECKPNVVYVHENYPVD